MIPRLRSPLGAALVAVALLGGCKNIEGGLAAEGTVGAECAGPDDCGEIITQATCLKMPGGYCSTECGGGLFDCDDQSLCEELGDQAYFCLDGCLTDNGSADCRGDYRCAPRPDVFNLAGEVGVCVPKCESDGDCETGTRCDTGTGDCIARGERKTGDSCSNNGQCNGGLCIQSDGFPGGYCSSGCGDQFSGCEANAECTTFDGQPVCMATCANDAACRDNEGYKCRQIATRRDGDGNDQAVSVCVPRCQSNAECEDGSHCDATSGDCEVGAGDPNPIGAFCTADSDCASDYCLSGDRYPNGLCAGDCAGCDAGTVCGQTPDGQACIAACDADLDCRPGYVCGADGGCTTRCTGDADCTDGLRCSGSTGRCVQPSSGGSTVDEVQIANSVTVSGQLSQELTLDVPEDAVGFAILADGAGDDLMLIGEMTDPSGRTIYDFQDPFGSEVRFFPSQDFITQYVPSSPRSAPQPGTYKFKLIKDGGSANINVRAVIKRTDGAPDGGRLDVNFFFAKVNGIDASSAPNQPEFQQAVSTMRSVYASQGVELGDVHYCDLTGGSSDRFSIIDSVEGPSSELSQMFAESGRAGDLGCSPERALNFFMVQEIVGGRAGYIILGISGGIPGPPGISGTTRSGVAVTMAGYTRNPSQLGQTMAHEGGHYLGLFHTTEAEGTAFDPLPDTPECQNSADGNRDGIVDYNECKGGKGSENLMFWAAGDSAEDVSGDQGFVVTRNPAVQ